MKLAKPLGLCAALLAGCAGTPDTTPVNGPLLASSRVQPQADWARGFGVEGDVVMLSLSGGGAWRQALMRKGEAARQVIVFD